MAACVAVMNDDQVLRYSQLIWTALHWLFILPCNILLVKVMLSSSGLAAFVAFFLAVVSSRFFLLGSSLSQIDVVFLIYV